ncbi:MAG: D-alanyl-D-alanine carboxypeptidase family protein [Lachnospiraceae bacterium]
MKKTSVLAILSLCAFWILSAIALAEEDPVTVEAPHALLMEVTTGTVLYERDSETQTAPASITKIMTLLLIFDALESGTIKLEDEVTVSEHAASMGGSQVYLEPFEKQTVETMIKCISVASANDACVAMAEYIAGSETEFVKRMNEKADSLGMDGTHFVNCCGLDTEGHLTTAKDVALMSRELLIEYPQIHDYCTIWMENITHVTAKGSSEFGLTNTNKLIRQYEYATGLKTGSTDDAGFCVSASAKKDGIELIAVVMNGETGKSRFADACTMLNYGFANCRVYEDNEESREKLPDISVKRGEKVSARIQYEKDFAYVTTTGEDLSGISKEVKVPEYLEAPVKKGDPIGEAEYRIGDRKIGTVRILCAESIEKAGYTDYLKRVWLAWMM